MWKCDDVDVDMDGQRYNIQDVVWPDCSVDDNSRGKNVLEELSLECTQRFAALGASAYRKFWIFCLCVAKLQEGLPNFD